MKYNGSCHCGAIKFECETEPIVAGLQCNCSICRRKNAIMSIDYLAPEQFRLYKGHDVMSVYHWGDRDVNHYFCAVCGIYPFHDTTDHPGRYRINLGCIDDINTSQLKIKTFDGKHKL